MREESQTEKLKQQPTYRQMGRYAVGGVLLTVLATPLLYAAWMRRSPLSWFSAESFVGFGWFVVIAGVVLVLVLIGSHGDDPEA
jgi:hypothetical protein